MKELFYVKPGDYYFKSTIEKVKAAFHRINYQILCDGFVSLNELYNILGLEETTYGEGVGWEIMYSADFELFQIVDEQHGPCTLISILNLHSREDIFKEFLF